MRRQETKGGTGVGTSIMVIKIIFNYPPQGEVNRGIYMGLFTDTEGDSCLSIYQISWIKI